MEWTKIPTTLITKRYSDYELISIIKFQLLWAELEECPDEKTCLRYMTKKQYDIAQTYRESIATGVGHALSSVKRKRYADKTRYNKNKNLQKIPQAERIPDSERNADTDKIRLDNNRYPPLYISPPKGKKENPDPEKYPPSFQKWLAYKKERKQKYTPTGEKQCLEKLKKLSNWNEDIAIQIVDQSIERGWSGLFELKEQINTPDDKDEERKWKEWCKKNKSKETMNEHTN